MATAITAIWGSVFDSLVKLTDHIHHLAEGKLLAPVTPGKIPAMRVNYTSPIVDRLALVRMLD